MTLRMNSVMNEKQETMEIKIKIKKTTRKPEIKVENTGSAFQAG